MRLLLSSGARREGTVPSAEPVTASKSETKLSALSPVPDFAHASDATPARPFITVAVPTYRRPDTIRRTIDSVVGQDFSDWELVVSDDEGPKGPSWPILEEYARSDPRIRIVENQRGRGQVENTNNAMLACTGKWIKLLHDDDWLAPGALKKFAEVSTKYPSAAFMTCAAHVVEENRVVTRTDPPEENRVSLYSSQECLTDLYLVRMTRSLGIIPSTLLINAAVIHAGCQMRAHKSIPAGVDQLFFVDLARYGEMVAINEGLIFYDATHHPSITTSKSYEDVDEVTLAVKQLNWHLIKDRKGLPKPESLLRALRVARIPARFRHQSLRTTMRDAVQILRPSVMKIANQYVLEYLFKIRPKLGPVQNLKR
ncbi:glycosyltransferase [Mesorhizobium sp. BH1-1-5]|uniref:glycosyltransferase family 2 protein n=1 Tax=unclassified Mesorhizobium TaxID=325217 RepID=UPI00112C6AAB|nr:MULTISPECIES: glycosyltransferase family 2 protein [unclassified Mesorhizobium]MBZ9986774.1 glycosyltransferase [Mesorhizobium sp. BH1-1-5]TPJ70645.1 glycosyltransferase family 2 protein [Mesorhizobium sp. B2-7-1]